MTKNNKILQPKRLPWLIIGVAVLVAAVLIIGRSRDVPVERPERAALVKTVTVDRQTIRPTLELFGSVQSPQNAKLSAGIDGLVMEVPVRDGESVAEDQVLVRLDRRDPELKLQQAEADLLEAQAQLSSAELRLERNRQALQRETELLALAESRSARAQELFEQGLLSESDLETSAENFKRQQLALSQAELAVAEGGNRLTELKAQRSRAEALRSQARLDVERAELKAPFPGVISELEVSEGDRVKIGDALMRLQNPAAIEVRTQIPARYAESVSVGLAADQPMPALIQVGEQRIPGRLVRLSGQTSESSGGVDGFVGFPSPPRILRLGSTVGVILELPPEGDVIPVPAEAIYGRDRLYKVVNDRMQMLSVERVGERIGPDGGSEVLVRSPDLSDADQIIVTKLANAADGLLVTVAEG